MPGLFLNHGITSVRDTGGELQAVLAAVAPMRADSATAPRVFYAGPLLDGEYVVYTGEGRPALGIANPDVATARANIARLAEAGVDFVKIYEMVSPEVFEVLVAEARARNLPIDGHVPLSMRAREVGPRVQSLEHLRNIEMDCASRPDALLAERRRRLRNTERVNGFTLRTSLHNLQRLPSVAAYNEAECAQVLTAMGTTIQCRRCDSMRSAFSRRSRARIGRRRSTSFPKASRQSGRRPVNALRRLLVPCETTRTASSVCTGEADARRWRADWRGHRYADRFCGARIQSAQRTRDAGARGLAADRGAARGHVAARRVLRQGRRDGNYRTRDARRPRAAVGDPLADITNTKRIEAVVTKGRLLDRAALTALVR